MRDGSGRRGRLGCVLAGLLASALTIPVQSAEPDGATQREDRAVGIAVVKAPQPYVGADEEWIPLPIFAYRKGGFFIEGIRLGYGWSLPASCSLQIAVMPQFAELDPAASPFLSGMEKRRSSVDGSLTLAWTPGRVAMALAVYSDLLSRSDGQRLEAEVGLPRRLGRWRIVPAAKLVWIDSDFADYYAGVRPAEALPERPAFRGTSTWLPGVALGVRRTLRRNWALVGQAEILFLGPGVRDSPVVDGDTMSFILAGIARTF